MFEALSVQSPSARSLVSHTANTFVEAAGLIQNCVFVNETHPTQQQLLSATDFCLLDLSTISSVRVLRREYGPLDIIADKGSDALHCYVVLQGSVDVFRSDLDYSKRRCGCIVPPNSFGGDDVVLETKLQYWYKAGPQKTVIALVPAPEYLRLIYEHKSFAQSIGRRLVERFDIFSRFRHFCKTVFTTQETVDVKGLVEKYCALDSVIHQHIDDPQLDTFAWGYATDRLPSNLTATFVLDLVNVLPAFLANRMRDTATSSRSNVNAVLVQQQGRGGGSSRRGSTTGSGNSSPAGTPGSLAHCPLSGSAGVVYVSTRQRRRYAWQAGNSGKTIVLLRDGFTDLLDFLTCFCIHVVESRKLRLRLTALPSTVDLLEEAVLESDIETPELQDDVMRRMPLTVSEAAGLKRLWGDRLLHRLYEVMMHKEMYLLRIASNMTSFQIDPFHQIMLATRRKMLELLGMASGDPLPDNLVVDIIACDDIHAVTNLMTPFARDNRDEILHWGEQNVPNCFKYPWKSQDDLVYACLIKYAEACAIFRSRLEKYHDDHGVRSVEDTALTALGLQVMRVSAMDLTNTDPELAAATGRASDHKGVHMLLHLSYAFGAQVDGIMRSLILLLGDRIRSVNVVSKAGGLVGDVGDIQIPTHVIFSKSSLLTEDATDDFRGCDNTDVDWSYLESIAPSAVHRGPVLTVPGTLLESRALLLYYRIIWGCVGVEKEGSYFVRQVVESRKLNLLSPTSVCMRFSYYTTDVPLSEDIQTARFLTVAEAVAARYAILRTFMRQLWKQN
eukprot:PhM_4_TR3472/c7_g1_i1/m.77874